ncbi:MAG: hypothetical protein K6E40_13125, partial [Desulfovibrio sp.]|nr:hypothetical protein [Desulfovibrio sp.]
MSDIKLARPAASSSFSVEPRKGDNFAIAFDPSEAVMSQKNGSLVFTFEDGAQIVIDNFYDVYSKEEMPSFAIGDIAIKGEDFFTAHNAGDIMPAAGPGQGQGASASGGRYGAYGSMDLMDGLGALDGTAYAVTVDQAEAMDIDSSTGAMAPIAESSLASEEGPEPEPAPEPEPSTIAVALSAVTPSVAEGGQLTYVATLSQVADDDMTVALS